MSETSDDRIARMRVQIAELFERDEEFARRSNWLLDDIVLTRDQADSNTRAIAESRRDIDQLAVQSKESRRNIDQLAERIGQLAQEISDLRQEVSEVTRDVQVLAFASSQMLEANQAFVAQAIADRLAFQAESRRIWDYLLGQNPNGKGEQSE